MIAGALNLPVGTAHYGGDAENVADEAWITREHAGRLLRWKARRRAAQRFEGYFAIRSRRLIG